MRKIGSSLKHLKHLDIRGRMNYGAFQYIMNSYSDLNFVELQNEGIQVELGVQEHSSLGHGSTGLGTTRYGILDHS